MFFSDVKLNCDNTKKYYQLSSTSLDDSCPYTAVFVCNFVRHSQQCKTNHSESCNKTDK